VSKDDCREDGDGGGVSERGGSIPRTGMTREAQRSSWALRQRKATAGGLGFHSGARREEEKEREGKALGLLRGGRGALIADGGWQRESWSRRSMRSLHEGASGMKVGDDSLVLGWAKVGFAKDERGRELGRIWPRTRKDSFFSKVFSISVFQMQFVVLKKIENSNLLKHLNVHGTSRH
jgi:hypothetical protein